MHSNVVVVVVVVVVAVVVVVVVVVVIVVVVVTRLPYALRAYTRCSILRVFTRRAYIVSGTLSPHTQFSDNKKLGPLLNLVDRTRFECAHFAIA